VFAQAVGCIFPAPTVIERDVSRLYGVRIVGKAETVRERYYVISAERRLKHPGVVAMTTAARDKLFG